MWPPTRLYPGGGALLEELTPEVVELAAARYGLRELLLLRHSRSGSSGRMTVEAMDTLLASSPSDGHCLIVDRHGQGLRQIARDAEWVGWRSAQPPSNAQTLAWPAGMQPRQAKTCLRTARATGEGRA